MNILCRINNNTSKASEKEEQKSTVSNSISDQDLQRLYSVEFKSQSYASFYSTTMEKDKSVLTLSVAGIGFLITLLKLTDTLALYDMIFFALASLGFLCSIFCIITLFGKNADYIVDLAQEKDVTLKQHYLKKLDTRGIRSFYLAIIMSLLLGISTSSTLFINGEEKVSKTTTEELVKSGVVAGNESFQQAQDLNESFQQAQNLTKSFQGATNMQPPTGSGQQQPSASSESTGAAAMMPKITSDEK